MMTERPQQPDGAWAQSLALTFRFLFLGIGLLGVAWIFSNCRLIQPDSRAVVRRFGAVVREVGPGLLLALPRPFEQILTLPSADRQIEYPVKTFTPNESIALYTRDTGGMLLTGDMSVVHFNATLFYRITDAKAYVLAQEQVTPALERLFVASTIAVAGSRDLDTILVARPELETPTGTARAGRERLRTDLMNEVNRRLTQLTSYGGGLGITVGRVDLVPAIPAEAKVAFDSVLTALQQAETQAAQARTDAEKTTQQYNQTRDRVLTDAEARAEEQIRQAQTRTAAIAALAQGTPGISGTALTNQIYNDRIGALFQRAGQVLTTDGSGGSHLILPGSSEK